MLPAGDQAGRDAADAREFQPLTKVVDIPGETHHEAFGTAVDVSHYRLRIFYHRIHRLGIVLFDPSCFQPDLVNCVPVFFRIIKPVDHLSSVWLKRLNTMFISNKPMFWQSIS